MRKPAVRNKKSRAPAVSARANLTPPSPMRKFLPLVLDAEKRGIRVLKLNVGDPDILPPPLFLKTVKRFKGPQVGYAPSPGFIVHVDAWRSYYKTLGISLERQNVIPMVGCAEAILYSLIAVTDPGDDVLVFEPFYPSYKSFAKMIGISLSPVTLSITNNYALPSDAVIERAIGTKTKAIVLINPNNPTGTVFSKTELSRIVRIAKKRNLFIISDETYRDIIFSGKPTSAITLSGAKERVIVIDSASKRFSLPGARIGCLISYNADVMAAVLRFCQARLSAGTLEQFGLIPLLKNPHAYVRKITTE
ncbi:aminotransferase class I/II-fold pyridoxal phosphate-dependent enzyme [Candidatus Kaiserbacteria bacterium]|nr:aminotransferase class I/II-fold pyridoxal phosphate-dependent enzyme [Candidatus Kaiserbacteria bacterium]